MFSTDPHAARLAQLEVDLLDGRISLPGRRELLDLLASEPRRDGGPLPVRTGSRPAAYAA